MPLRDLSAHPAGDPPRRRTVAGLTEQVMAFVDNNISRRTLICSMLGAGGGMIVGFHIPAPKPPSWRRSPGRRRRTELKSMHG
ncbi:hypothetical protein N5A92_17260 [Chelativorans sp. EGI FJ00035]|uniref:Uncharacterized protein n=1 Tax=Chelativorans salis TaxID=2978478 RepID=A0ABT2LRR8_9HYPH|nr:hypothetical protein [Chelativorans sp. EGI FJ00035]MCT7376784.1 hypothetical protein [Chelativorans sp. EGI FJ00035]